MTPAANRPDLGRIGESAFTQVLNSLSSRSFAAGNPASSLAASAGRDQITSSVLLTGPRLSGRVLVQFPKAFVTHAAHVLTGFDGTPAETNELLDDTAGELANMVAGRVASRLLEDGYECCLGTPSISLNSVPSLELSPGVERGRAELTWEGHRLAVEIQCRYTAL